MERELLAKIPESSLELIIAEQYKNKLEWEEKNKEFSLNGEMYDVAKIKIIDGKTHLYCINDKKEKQLLDNLVGAVNKNHDNKQGRNNIKPFLIDLVFPICCDSKVIAEPKESFSRGHTMSHLLIFPAERSTSTLLRITKNSINRSLRTTREAAGSRRCEQSRQRCGPATWGNRSWRE